MLEIEPIKVLLIDDDEDDALIAQALLSDVSGGPHRATFLYDSPFPFFACYVDVVLVESMFRQSETLRRYI